MPPEGLTGAGVGRNADTWAMGLMAARALTEYFPFDDILCMLFFELYPLMRVYSATCEHQRKPTSLIDCCS
jgi:hypothetical protein